MVCWILLICLRMLQDKQKCGERGNVGYVSEYSEREREIEREREP
jgi:hypothetical protein